MGGLQAQYAPSMYIGLWTRVRAIERDGVTRALERRLVVQGTLMRDTIHLVARRDYWPFAVAVRRSRRDWWARAASVDPKAMEAAAERLRARLRDGPVRRAELEAIVGKGMVIGIGMWVDMVRVPPSGTWERRRADLVGSAEQWVGPQTVTSEEDAVDHLVRRYLAAFGPASPKDVADFTRIRPATLAASLDRLDARRFRDERGGLLLDVQRAPLPDPATPAPVRFLPTWDATLLVHARRTGILPERVYTKDELRKYLRRGRDQCRKALAALTDDKARERREFTWGEVSVAELHLYNLRHVQHHAAQLNLILRQKTDSAPDWVGQAEDPLA